LQKSLNINIGCYVTLNIGSMKLNSIIKFDAWLHIQFLTINTIKYNEILINQYKE